MVNHGVVILVSHDAIYWFPSADSQGKRIRCKVRACSGMHCLADYPTRERAEHDATAQFSSPVGCTVLSVTRSWFGPLRVEFRSARSVAVTPCGVHLLRQPDIGNTFRPGWRIGNLRLSALLRTCVSSRRFRGSQHEQR